MSGLLERFREGDRAALARLLTHIENQTELGRQALTALSADPSRSAHVIGVTGPPGAGKSTLVDRLVTGLRQRGSTVAVLAIDPSSPLTGGATLGDRIRMLEHGADDGVFVRSMASRGQLGGLALATFGAAQILERFGFDTILIETVGVGQDEVDIARLADTVLLLQVPGLGDSVQSIKAGVLEIADVIAVNKSDLPGARDVLRELRHAVRSHHADEPAPPLIAVSAISGEGVVTLCDRLDEHRKRLASSETRELRRRERLRFHARLLAVNALDRWIDQRRGIVGTEESQDPHGLAERWLSEFADERRRPDG